MKKTIALFLIVPSICTGQIQFSFENEDTEMWIKSRTSSWDTSSLDAISGRYSLKHVYDNPEAGHDQASFCIDSLHPEAGSTEWQFIIKHGYDPSSSNNWSVFLIADADATRMFPASKFSGYAIGVNYSGSDDILKLWKINQGMLSDLINTGLNWQESISINPAGIKVIRSQDGIWEVFIRDGHSDYNKAGEGMDEELFNVTHFGIYYEYSAKQDCKLWLDNILISGVFIRDTIPPVMTDLKVTGSNTLLLTFSEPLDTFYGISPANFYAGEYLGYPAEVSIDAPDILSLIFEKDFPAGTLFTLFIEGLYDRKGNLIRPEEDEFVYYPTGWFNIIVNEIMADPSPPMGLAEFEYIELLNRGELEVCMTDWYISCGNLIKIFPEISLDPGEFLLLVHEDAKEEFSRFGKCLPVFSSRTSLPNTGACIELRDEKDRIISWAIYSDEWFENDYYRSGGWSLERIDSDRFCAGSENWKGSIDPAGGTPGYPNSVAGKVPDTINPIIEYIEIPVESAIQVYFSEPMDSTTLLNLKNYIISQGILNPFGIELSGPDYRSLILHLSQSLEAGIVYNLKISADLKDCSGNALICPDSIKFAKPEPAENGDILISEIMFDPLSGYSEFIEIYNNSSKTIDLSEIVIAEKDLQTGGMISFTAVCPNHRLFFPGEFLVIVKDKTAFLTGYPNACGIIIESTELFSLDDERGTVVVLDKWLQVLDEFTYDDNMHFSLLASTEGISLERISYERSAEEKYNWHSAAKDAGFCTPGYENSQFIVTSNQELDIGIKPEIFTPDNDGRDDFTNIFYSFDNPGYVINIWIFDPMGRLIRQLALNMFAGTSGSIVWDGTDDNGRRAQMGIYLIYVRIFDLTGKVSQIKKTCILSIKK